MEGRTTTIRKGEVLVDKDDDAISRLIKSNQIVVAVEFNEHGADSLSYAWLLLPPLPTSKQRDLNMGTYLWYPNSIWSFLFHPLLLLTIITFVESVDLKVTWPWKKKKSKCKPRPSDNGTDFQGVREKVPKCLAYNSRFGGHPQEKSGQSCLDLRFFDLQPFLGRSTDQIYYRWAEECIQL